MNIPVFDPVFNSAPAQTNKAAASDRGRFLFDGWSYEPLDAKREEPRATNEQHR
jgi:hypothetical protein